MSEHAGDLVISGLGLPVGVSFEGVRADEVRAAFAKAWSRCLVSPAQPPTPAVTLTLDPERPVPSQTSSGETVRANELGPLLQSATQSVTSHLIRSAAGRLLMFHAAALCHPISGDTVVAVAPGGTGKTTFARTLGQHYGYISDETVALERDGGVLPYPKPLSVRVAGQSHKSEVSPDELGLLPAHPAPRVRRIVLIRRDKSLDAPAVDDLDLLDAITRLAPETSSLSKLDRGLHALADVIEATGGVQLWRYAEASSLRDLVADTIGGAP